MRPALLLLCSLIACGRAGFDPRIAPAGDALRDAAIIIDPFDADPFDAARACEQPGPYIGIVMLLDMAGFLELHICAAGITGDIAVSLIQANQMPRDTKVVPPSTQIVSVFVGGASCIGCVIRFEADGHTFETPPYDFAGD